MTSLRVAMKVQQALTRFPLAGEEVHTVFPYITGAAVLYPYCLVSGEVIGNSPDLVSLGGSLVPSGPPD